jgi:hypothetical protein
MHDELKIEIKKNGEVWIHADGLSPRKLHQYRELLEEILGPAKIISDSGDAPPPMHVKFESADEERDSLSDPNKKIEQEQ